MDKEYDNEKKGYLWHETDSEIVRKGTVTVEGDKYYCGIIERTHSGEKKYEFFISAGLLHPNHEKLNENSPDMSGMVTINGNSYKLGCWAKENSNGPFTSVGLRDVTEKKQDNWQGSPDSKNKASF